MSRVHSLLRSFGPECPHCGCPMNLAFAGMNGGRPYSVFKCEFCSHQQAIGRAPAPESVKVSGPVVYKTERCKCPNCGSKNPPVVNTSGPVRWHKCGKCGHTFKSVEGE